VKASELSLDELFEGVEIETWERDNMAANSHEVSYMGTLVMVRKAKTNVEVWLNTGYASPATHLRLHPSDEVRVAPKSERKPIHFGQ
jgi:hypothetical protein